MGRIDLAAVERSLRDVQRQFERINAQLAEPRDPLSEEVLARLLAGYERVDALLAERVDLLAYGQSAAWLELNTLVLCGRDPATRADHAAHIAATAARFYGEPGAGIGAVVDWHARHRGDSAWERAAGIYVRILSEPQLYIEGNHRTGALVMSYLLARDGKPPFVLSPANARGYFDPSSMIKGTRKTTYGLLLKLPGIKRRFARFLAAQADPTLLRAAVLA
jgi:hypothetical protein